MSNANVVLCYLVVPPTPMPLVLLLVISATSRREKKRDGAAIGLFVDTISKLTEQHSIKDLLGE